MYAVVKFEIVLLLYNI